MLYSMNDPIEGDDEDLETTPDDEKAEGETQTETHTVTRHKASGKFVKGGKPKKNKPHASSGGGGPAVMRSHFAGTNRQPPKQMPTKRVLD